MKKNKFIVKQLFYSTLLFIPFSCSYSLFEGALEDKNAQGYVAIKFASAEWGDPKQYENAVWQNVTIPTEVLKEAYNVPLNGYSKVKITLPKSTSNPTGEYSVQYMTTLEKPKAAYMSHSEGLTTIVQKGWMSDTKLYFSTLFFDTKKDFDEFFQNLINKTKKDPTKYIAVKPADAQWGDEIKNENEILSMEIQRQILESAYKVKYSGFSHHREESPRGWLGQPSKKSTILVLETLETPKTTNIFDPYAEIETTIFINNKELKYTTRFFDNYQDLQQFYKNPPKETQKKESVDIKALTKLFNDFTKNISVLYIQTRYLK